MQINLQFASIEEQDAYFARYYGGNVVGITAPTATTVKEKKNNKTETAPTVTPAVNIETAPGATPSQATPTANPAPAATPGTDIAAVRKALKDLAIKLDEAGKGSELDAHIAKYTNTGKLKSVPDDKVQELYEALTLLNG